MILFKFFAIIAVAYLACFFTCIFTDGGGK